MILLVWFRAAQQAAGDVSISTVINAFAGLVAVAGLTALVRVLLFISQLRVTLYGDPNSSEKTGFLHSITEFRGEIRTHIAQGLRWQQETTDRVDQALVRVEHGLYQIKETADTIKRLVAPESGKGRTRHGDHAE